MNSIRQGSDGQKGEKKQVKSCSPVPLRLFAESAHQRKEGN